MFKVHLLALAAASFVFTSHASPFADEIISYDPGVGFASRFTNPDAALGEPSRINPYGDPTDPFDPPYGTNQIVSIGAGGSLVVEFQTPILNHPNNLYGFDFIIFGNAFFTVTNWIGTPATASTFICSIPPSRPRWTVFRRPTGAEISISRSRPL